VKLFTSEQIISLIATALLVTIGVYFFDMTRGEAYVLWFVILGGMRTRSVVCDTAVTAAAVIIEQLKAPKP
jgi:hypothetical protein